jgi:hypothetical protein
VKENLRGKLEQFLGNGGKSSRKTGAVFEKWWEIFEENWSSF